MATLSPELRKALEKVVLKARGQAEAGARKALEQLAVAHREPWPTMTPGDQALRRRLRARGRQLGDRLEERGKHGIEHLVAECAYEHWHRMLFARFLAECDLLIETESGMSVSVDECKELARERGIDWISLASTFAQNMLPQIFRADDPLLEITLPAEHRQPLEQLLTTLPKDVFVARDSLGWVYQFWQAEEKKRVNDSEMKIGADTLPAVTQLFTDDYMVEFLLHNTLGAWWAGKHLGRYPNLAATASNEDEVRQACRLQEYEWTYLRFTRQEAGWQPTAGVFEPWPDAAKRIRILDPCAGSGHFLVFALPILVAMRMEEEALSKTAAVSAVLRDNLFGLELDPRCTQIAAFNLALTAWRAVGFCSLPQLNIACSGLAIRATEQDWVAIAGSNEPQRKGMEALYRLFRNAPTLGSLINPRRIHGDLLESAFQELQPLLVTALARESNDEDEHELAVTGYGLSRAAAILASQFTLTVTNVPYLGRAKQDSVLLEYCASHHPDSKADLATCFIERMIDFCADGCTASFVAKEEWLFLGQYKGIRRRALTEMVWSFVGHLGPRAFEAISGERVNVSLHAMSAYKPRRHETFFDLDVSIRRTPREKALGLISETPTCGEQSAQLLNPDARVSTHSVQKGATTLSSVADSYQGIVTGDLERFRLRFWEVPALQSVWVPFRTTVSSSFEHDGCQSILRWEEGSGQLHQYAQETRDQLHDMHESGNRAWNQRGIALNRMSQLQATIYSGEHFDNNVAVLIPKSEETLPALLEFCGSLSFAAEVRKLDRTIKVTNRTLTKVPFDLSHWQHVASEKYPNGIALPQSDDPTQWLFDGHPRLSRHPLHVAVARLLGYRWPRQTGLSVLDCETLDADGLDMLCAQDGIVCISATKGEDSAPDRLSALLATALGAEWTGATLDGLLKDVGYGGKTIEDWLRNGFFEQHCEIFHQRPFIWHIWDGRRDGFSALVNYHKLTKTNLERLTFGYLGDWILREEAAAVAGEAGSEARLLAAKQLQNELKKILEGQPPYDIFIRWKELAHQPRGWEPDLNDGVRVNIRPFVMATDVGKKGAGILRAKPSIKWEKDRGREPSRQRDDFPWFWGWDGKITDFAGGASFDGNRWNDLHYSRESKAAARRLKGLS